MRQMSREKRILVMGLMRSNERILMRQIRREKRILLTGQMRSTERILMMGQIGVQREN